MSFKIDTPLEKRIQLSEKMREKYPDRLPIIIEIQKQPNPIQLSQTRFIVHKSYTVGRLITEIRKNSPTLKSDEAMFLFCDAKNNGILAPISKTVEELYTQYKDADGFLYFTVAKENVFGQGILEVIDSTFNGIFNGISKFLF